MKKGIVDIRIGKIIHKAYEDRSDSDYGIFTDFEKNEVLNKLEEMKEFIKTVTALIDK